MYVSLPNLKQKLGRKPTKTQVLFESKTVRLGRVSTKGTFGHFGSVDCAQEYDGDYPFYIREFHMSIYR